MRPIALISLMLLTLAVGGSSAYAYTYSDYNWKPYGGHQYAATLQYSNWQTAENWAQEVGGHLVQIDNTYENAWLSTTFKGIYRLGHEGDTWQSLVWIGLHYIGGDITQPSSWQWTTGQPLAITPPWWRSPAIPPPEIAAPYAYIHTDTHLNPGTWYNHEKLPPYGPFLTKGIIELPFVGPPVAKSQPSVDTQEVSNFDADWAKLPGKVIDDGGAPCTCWFTYRKQSESTWTPSGSTGPWRQYEQFSVTVKGLKADTTYVFRAHGQNSAGESVSGEKTFKTAKSLVTLKRFEINQAFQEVCDDGVTQKYALIETKPFVVRVDLEMATPGSTSCRVSLDISSSKTGQTVGGIDKSNVGMSFGSPKHLDFLIKDTATLNKMIAGEASEYKYNFRLLVENYSGSVLLDWTKGYTFKSASRSINIFVIETRDENGICYEWDYNYMAMPEQMFPMPRRGAVAINRFKVDISTIIAAVEDFRFGGTATSMMVNAAAAYFAKGLVPADSKFDILCLMVPPSFDKNPGNQVGSVIAITPQKDTRETSAILAHELAHCFGLGEEFVESEGKIGGWWQATTNHNMKDNPPPLIECLWSEATWSIPSWDWMGVLRTPCKELPIGDPPTNFGFRMAEGDRWSGGNLVGPGGYDVLRGTEIPTGSEIPIVQRTGTLMNSMPFLCWISGIEYGVLQREMVSTDTQTGSTNKNAASLDDLRVLESSLAVRTSVYSLPILPVRVLLTGVISLTNKRADLVPIVLAPGATLASPAADPNYQLWFRTKEGEPLGTHNFSLLWGEYSNEAESPFAVVVDLPEGAGVIEVLMEGTLAGQWTLSANSPVVKVLAPNGGEILSGQADIRWTGSDVDGDKLTYTVEYSYDGGIQWHPLALGWSEQELKVDINDLPGGTNCLIKVTSSDGWNQGSDTSDGPFTVPTKPPKVTILDPNEGRVFSLTEPMQGRCVVRDPETGEITDANAIVWSSNIDGVLGKGSLIGFELSPGSHVLTVTATDPEGKSTTASVNVQVVVTEEDRQRMRPVAHWPFDDGKGDVAADAVGMNNGKVYGASWQAGKVGGSLSFDGVDDYVDCGKSLLLSPETLTLAFWVYREPSVLGYGVTYPVYKGTGSLFYTDYSIGLFAANGIVEFSFGNDSSTFLNLQSQSKVNTREWTHIAVTRDGSRAAIYLNGSLDIGKAYMFAPENKGHTMTVGSMGGGSKPFKGKVDDLRIYDHALSEKKIKGLFEETSK